MNVFWLFFAGWLVSLVMCAVEVNRKSFKSAGYWWLFMAACCIGKSCTATP